MNTTQRVWLWIAAAIAMISGLLLVLNDSGAGWFLIILGFTYLGGSTRAGQGWAASNPGLARWGLIGLSLLLVLLVMVVILLK